MSDLRWLWLDQDLIRSLSVLGLFGLENGRIGGLRLPLAASAYSGCPPKDAAQKTAMPEESDICAVDMDMLCTA